MAGWIYGCTALSTVFQAYKADKKVMFYEKMNATEPCFFGWKEMPPVRFKPELLPYQASAKLTEIPGHCVCLYLKQVC